MRSLHPLTFFFKSSSEGVWSMGSALVTERTSFRNSAFCLADSNGIKVLKSS